MKETDLDWFGEARKILKKWTEFRFAPDFTKVAVVTRNHAVNKDHFTGRLKCSEMARQEILERFLRTSLCTRDCAKSKGPSERKGALNILRHFS